MTANASVALLYYADEPNGMSPVSARLGGPKAGGWTADQALENLARVIPDVGLPDFLPTAARADESELVSWLRRRTGEPALAS